MIDRRSFTSSFAFLVAGLTTAVPGIALARPPRIRLTDAQWRRRLNPAAYAVLRKGSTERPFSSPLDKEKRRGVYRCAGCSQPLFVSAAKFDSGTGWPSFFRALPGATGTKPDDGRTEVHCSRCGGHLGHVFDDGPPPTGKRYCMNGVALCFQPG